MPVYPTILTSEVSVLQEQFDLAAQFPDITAVQVDIIDGEFADTQTVALQTLLDVNTHDIPLDLHLMVNEPMDYVWEIIEWKDSLQVRSVIAQIERMSYPEQYLEEVKRHNWRAGLAWDIYTPLDEMEPEWLIDVDMIQLLGGPAGKQGQPLHDQIWPKLAELQSILETFARSPKAQSRTSRQPIEILVDVGVNHDTAPRLVKAGVTGLAVGSAIWKASDPVESYRQLAEYVVSK